MLINKQLKNRRLYTQFGPVEFDVKGVAQGLQEAQEEVFKDLPDFTFKANGEAHEATKQVAPETKSALPDLESLTVAQLKDFAQKQKLTIPVTVTKKEDIKNFIIDALKGA